MDKTEEQLKQFIEVWEEYDRQLKELQELRSEHKKSGKSEGFDIKICSALIKERKRSQAEVQEEQALLETYREALNGTKP